MLWYAPLDIADGSELLQRSSGVLRAFDVNGVQPQSIARGSQADTSLKFTRLQLTVYMSC